MTIRYTLEDSFDAAIWEVAPLPGRPWTSVLAQWAMPVDPVDDGPDPEVQRHLAHAILKIGPALYASADPGPAAEVIGKIPAKGARRPTLSILHARTPEALLPAFDAGGACWVMGAQWIAILDHGQVPGSSESAFMSELFEKWAVDPGKVPKSIPAILRPAVDGDAAVIHLRHPDRLSAFADAWVST